MQLRYMGFDQAENIREYKFESGAAGETAEHFVVGADLALFTQYRVALQEGPALCLKKLTADLETPQQLPHQLTNAHIADRAPAARSGDGAYRAETGPGGPRTGAGDDSAASPAQVHPARGRPGLFRGTRPFPRRVRRSTRRSGPS